MKQQTFPSLSMQSSARVLRLWCVLPGLLHPSATIMDVNIGAALWMAAQAEGKLTVIKGSAAATSPIHPTTHATQSANTHHHHEQNQTSAKRCGASPEPMQMLPLAQQHDPAEHNTQTQHCSQRWYRSAARVVLLGHGADEQHAGYGRHRTSFRNQVLLSSRPRSTSVVLWWSRPVVQA